MFKNIAIAATAVALSASAAAANNIAFIDAQDEGQASITFDLVNADMAGLLQVETFNGKVLGSQAIAAGANADVRVNTLPLPGDVVARLIVGGETVDTRRVFAE
ncbi:MAG: hypothetical protein ACU0DW_02110 [Shimia sp.]